MSEDIMGLVKHMKISEEQETFLEAYRDNLDVMESARIAGLDTRNIHRSLRSNTPFAKMFRRLVDEIDKDPRFNKLGSLSMLLDLKNRAQEAKNQELELKIIQEINKMIKGNIASNRKIVENRNFQITGKIDLSKPIDEPDVLDVDYEELDKE